jgi:hypothetical protein
MGLFSYICGTFKCLRCKNVVSECIQTKLFHVTPESSSKQYHIGDHVAIDGLGDYIEICPWAGADPLRVVVGDWSCDVCGLNYQWAPVTFEVKGSASAAQPFLAKIAAIETFVPGALAFAGVHYIEEALAELAFFPDQRPDSISVVKKWSVEQKVASIAGGYTRWVQEVATK